VSLLIVLSFLRADVLQVMRAVSIPAWHLDRHVNCCL
jgi:hypothetical protein